MEQDASVHVALEPVVGTRLESLATMYYGYIYNKQADVEEFRRGKPWLVFNNKDSNGILCLWRGQRFYEINIDGDNKSSCFFPNIHSALRYGLHLIYTKLRAIGAQAPNANSLRMQAVKSVNLSIFEVRPRAGVVASSKEDDPFRHAKPLSDSGELVDKQQLTAIGKLVFPEANSLESVDTLEDVVAQLKGDNNMGRLGKVQTQWKELMERNSTKGKMLMSPGLMFAQRSKISNHLVPLGDFKFNQIVGSINIEALSSGTLGDVLKALTSGAFVRRTPTDRLVERTDAPQPGRRASPLAPNNHPYAAGLAGIFTRLEFSSSGLKMKRHGVSIDFLAFQPESRLASDLVTATEMNNEEEIQKLIEIIGGDTDILKRGEFDVIIAKLTNVLKGFGAGIAPANHWVSDWIGFFRNIKHLAKEHDQSKQFLAGIHMSYVRYILSRALGWDVARVNFGIMVNRSTRPALDELLRDRVSKSAMSFRTRAYGEQDNTPKMKYTTENLEALAKKDGRYALRDENVGTNALVAYGTIAYTPTNDELDRYGTTLVTADQLYDRGNIILDLDTKAKVNRLIAQAMRAYAVLGGAQSASVTVSDDGKYAAPRISKHLSEGDRSFTLECPKPERQASSSSKRKKTRATTTTTTTTKKADMHEKRMEIDADEEAAQEDNMIIDPPALPTTVEDDPEKTQPLDERKPEVEAPEEDDEEGIVITNPLSPLRRGQSEVEASEEEDVPQSPPEVQQAQEIPPTPPQSPPRPSLKRKRSDSDSDVMPIDDAMMIADADAVLDGLVPQKIQPIYQMTISETQLKRHFKKPRTAAAIERAVANVMIQRNVANIKNQLGATATTTTATKPVDTQNDSSFVDFDD